MKLICSHGYDTNHIITPLPVKYQGKVTNSKAANTKMYLRMKTSQDCCVHTMDFNGLPTELPGGDHWSDVSPEQKMCCNNMMGQIVS